MLDLVRCELLASAVLAIDLDQEVFLRRVAAKLVRVDDIRHLTDAAGQSGVLLDLLIRVPEPLVDLIDGEAELLGDCTDLLSLWHCTAEALVEVPQQLFLALRLAGLACLIGPYLLGRRGAVRLSVQHGSVYEGLLGELFIVRFLVAFSLEL